MCGFHNNMRPTHYKRKTALSDIWDTFSNMTRWCRWVVIFKLTLWNVHVVVIIAGVLYYNSNLIEIFQHHVSVDWFSSLIFWSWYIGTSANLEVSASHLKSEIESIIIGLQNLMVKNKTDKHTKGVNLILRLYLFD